MQLFHASWNGAELLFGADVPMERILVLRAPLLHEHIVRKRCRIATIIVCVGVCLFLLPAFHVYSYPIVGTIPCFFLYEQTESIDLLRYVYLGMISISCLMPVTVLPVLNVILVYSIRQINKAHNALNPATRQNDAKSTNKKSIEIRAAISSIIISIYTSLCLSSNLVWTPSAFGTFY